MTHTPLASQAQPDYATRHKLSDLLDLYRDEIGCKQYNGWVRQRDPDDIRRDIDAEIERLTDGVPVMRRAEDLTPADAPRSPEHVCGLQGYNGMIAPAAKLGAHPPAPQSPPPQWTC